MMRPALFLRFALPIFALTAAGCAMSSGEGYPSLAKRPVEGRLDVAPPTVAVDPPGPLPVELGGRLVRWRSDAAASGQAFATERATAESLVGAAAGASVASERWIVAQQAISRLQSTRAPLTAALADIDRLYLERRIEEAVDGLPEIYALRDELAALAAAQDGVIAALNRQLPGQ